MGQLRVIKRRRRMKKLNPKEIIVPIAVLLIICVGVTAILAAVNNLTKEPIAQQAQQKAEQARAVVLPNAESFEQVSAELDGVSDAYKGIKNGETVGYTFTASSNGYGGAVEVMVGIDSASGEISGVSILSQSETPGLGANAVKSEFTDQYKQKAQEITVIKNAEPKDGEIEALTGATITSKAVTSAVNNAVAAYEEIVKGGE